MAHHPFFIVPITLVASSSNDGDDVRHDSGACGSICDGSGNDEPSDSADGSNGVGDNNGDADGSGGDSGDNGDNARAATPHP